LVTQELENIFPFGALHSYHLPRYNFIGSQFVPAANSSASLILALQFTLLLPFDFYDKLPVYVKVFSSLFFIIFFVLK
jgi:hypothetical protein